MWDPTRVTLPVHRSGFIASFCVAHSVGHVTQLAITTTRGQSIESDQASWTSTSANLSRQRGSLWATKELLCGFLSCTVLRTISPALIHQIVLADSALEAVGGKARFLRTYRGLGLGSWGSEFRVTKGPSAHPHETYNADISKALP